RETPRRRGRDCGSPALNTIALSLQTPQISPAANLKRATINRETEPPSTAKCKRRWGRAADLADSGHRPRGCVSHAAGLVAGVRVFVSGDASEFLGSGA